MEDIVNAVWKSRSSISTRENILIKRLKENFTKGQPLDKIKAADVRACLFGTESSAAFNKHFVGRILRKVFPEIKRKRIHSCWYYYGINIREKTQRSDSNTKQPTPYADVSVLSVGKEQQQEELAFNNQGNLINESKAYKIPSLNIFEGDLHFKKEDIIGEGTFGKCFSGKYKELPVAIKLFKDQQDYKAVHRECDILTMIPSHPNIAMLLGAFTIKRPFVLVTKLCTTDGHPKTYSQVLKEWQKSNTINLKIFLSIMYDMCSAMSHIHKHDILHNDIKSNNFVIEKMGDKNRPVLIDFGKATLCSSRVRPKNGKTMSSTERANYRKRYPHIAPEISSGKAQSSDSDTYSFGYMFCVSMKVLIALDMLGMHQDTLLTMGQSLTHYYPNKRISLQKVMIIFQDRLAAH